MSIIGKRAGLARGEGGLLGFFDVGFFIFFFGLSFCGRLCCVLLFAVWSVYGESGAGAGMWTDLKAEEWHFIGIFLIIY